MTTKANNTISTLPAASADPQSLLMFCKASADQLRLDVLKVLSHDSYGVLELCSIFDTKQSGMSHHLKILANAGLVKTRREGNTIFYRRANRSSNPQLNELQQALHHTIDQQAISEPMQSKVDAVQKERAASSELFFTENADMFSQQQEQIAAYELYGHNTIDLISRSFSTSNSGIALEVGPGEGAFLAELSPRFQQVYALDNSQQMLDKAAHFAQQSALANIDFIYGDTKNTQVQQLNADCVAINMVLHHTPSPAEIFYDMAAALKTGGQLFVTDLCSHDQSWARESCGDLWLGFEPEDLTQWAADAGFKTGENIYLAQRNGFRVQIRQFIKI
ncbi:MAG: metalloregulator ArsR/SmtB family transcription factor [Oceanicoccus sp.]|uniref:ArsR/SmtB family transcription factor n=1 Tax=Oceanicoccus sp. TaxID=2691044 RepID=UPI00262AE90C|nr:metalloregulator ArsR/SmtB family transcription factor [Oceanicoccus sp.]MDG1772726.1 metalloregulator ArsR/SmtB family transcription factor [Oceanicoccus sp.]